MLNVDVTYREELAPTFERLQDKLASLNKLRPFPQVPISKIKEALQIEWTYNSNSIEGNTLSLQETQMVLQEGITVSGKSLREHFEAKNHETAINYLYTLIKENYQLTSSDIISLHGLVLRSIEDEYAGRIRTGGVRIS